MIHFFIFGLLVGWGVALPIGPSNLETIRRNLSFGTLSGLSFGVGIVSADLTYFIFLNLGVVAILIHNPWIICPIGIIGSLILFWFAYKTLRMKIGTVKAARDNPLPLWKHIRDAYILTALSPFTVIFWASMSGSVAVSSGNHYELLWMVVGLICAVCSWQISLNTVLHYTHHRLSGRAMHILNRSGGIILLCFAVFSLWKAVELIWR